MDDEFNDRMKAFKRELRELGEEIETLRKRKANGEDVEAIAKKVSEMESEMRSKFNSLQSGNAELLDGLKKLTSAVEGLRGEVATQKTTVNTLQETQKVSGWSRIPIIGWAMMAVGCFAVLQLGLERWAEFQGMGR